MEADMFLDGLPGTTIMVKDHHYASSENSELKRDGDIVLQPQPSDDPNDPLNWEPYRKNWHIAMICVFTLVTSAIANDAGSAQDQMNEQLDISYDAMDNAAGVLFICVGYFTYIFMPASQLYGRRCVYMICLVFGMLGSLWFAKTKNAPNSIANQAFVGISESASEALTQFSLSEIVFEHERGIKIGIYILSTSVGTYLGPLAAGYVASSQGWRWIGWWGLICCAITFVLFLFTFEETAFDRTKAFEIGKQRTVATQEGAQKLDEEKEDDQQLDEEKKDDQQPSLDTAKHEVSVKEFTGASTDSYKRPSYWQRIALFTPATSLSGWGFRQYVVRLVQTLRIFLFPAVIYSGLQWGAQNAWLSFYLTTMEEDWMEAPYNYGDNAVAIMNVPLIIGATIGCFYAGYLGDYIVIWFAKRNKGVKEAEMRLWMMILPCIINPLGLFLFGIGTARHWHWAPTYVGLGCIGFGWGCAGDTAMAYLMDAYPGMVLEGMVAVSVINNTFGYVFTFACQSWIDSIGTEKTYISIGILCFFFIFTSFFMILLGKRMRKITAKYYFAFLRVRGLLDNQNMEENHGADDV
ncbi:transmembrane transporter [Schizosaccharomyces osmophilus]|uniref:Transmembrane transporter n=1 Tax=Schizosaccharomyces osmophilus TaxID=2545709 RepID=A0AAE9WA40_9SCHI|nr:transmembrane transporter [Schizosaccharomyces osmophilus]WBW72464.1 transmembrane transporter [Schizosaccharomyces osmophilus]